ncbi:uncharacterized protein LOC100242519 [Vitis vinifera]|uniref:uncharacterized protein LOC100242519 n=1 Tax=Vitis vinifera TaxID=29760 RepID=UPI00053FBB4D|nr:uncharacterized protein LOC100242519 [Vitis vinifera]
MASNLTPSSGQDSTTHSQSSRSKTDPAREHVSEERYGNGRRALICLYCKKITKGGGIHRMKLHLAGVKGDIGPCKSVPPNVRFRMENSLQEFVNAKKATKEADEYRNPYGPNVSQFEGDMAEGEEEVQEMQSPMAASSGKRKKSTVDKYFAPRNTQGAQPSMRSVLAGKEATWRADMAVGRFFYDACIPTNAMNSFYFKPMLMLYLQLDATNLFQLFDEVIEWVGPLNVVHVVTDNTANYVAAGRLISQKHKHINWSPCAAHCLNLIFKDIGKIDHVAELVRRASKVTIFVYNHVALLSWLRKREGWTEILRPSATRFATTFIALKSLHDHKHDLQALVTSKFFVDSRYSKDYKSQVAVSIILDNRFWNDCLIVVNLMSPLMRLLRIVDCDERPSMEYVYEGMYRVRLGIKKLFNYNERLYEPYTEIIKQRWDQQLKKSIHSAAYWLNPCFQYDQENFCNKPNVIGGVMDVIDQKVLKGKIETMNEMRLFRDRLGSFGRDLAYSSCEKREIMYDHLLDNGIARNYVRWLMHGEYEFCEPTNTSTNESDMHDEMQEMLNDAFGMPMPNEESERSRHVYEEFEKPNEDANKFYNLLSRARTISRV